MATNVLWEATSFKGLIGILNDSKISVAKSCQAVEECISANRDNLRGFFEQCFAPLVARIFGYSGPSWLGQVARSGKDADVRALRRLLSPTGPLFTAVYNADADGSTRFHFPRQRLPAHTQMMLSTAAGISALSTWPQYAASLGDDATAAAKGHIHVSVFQYFCYWFAFYAIKGGDAGSYENCGSGGGGVSGFGSSVRRAADALHLTRGKDADPALRYPYIALLRQMLVEMVPQSITASPVPMASPVRRSGGVGGPLGSPYYRSPAAKRGGDASARGLIFYSTLLEFWLKDADEPVPVASNAGAKGRSGAGGGGASSQQVWATSYEPPSEDLLEALTELVRYATVGMTRAPVPAPAQSGPPWLPMTSILTIQTPTSALAPGRAPGAVLQGPPRLGAAAHMGAQALSRQLFRFFHRAFSMWPDQRTTKPLLRAFLAFVAPWQGTSGAAGVSGTDAAVTGAGTAPGAAALTHNLTAHVSELVHRVSRTEAHPRGGEAGGYTPDWESHVMCNLPFYLELFPLFLERSVSRISVRGETAVGDVLRVMAVLEGAPALLETLRSFERDFNRCAASQPRRAEGPHADLMPWLIEQAQDWQVAATANALGDTPASVVATEGLKGPRPAAPSYAMFSVASDRCAALAAKDLLEVAAGMLRPEALSRVRRCLEQVLPLAVLAESPTPSMAAAGGKAGIADLAPRLPRSTWREVRFKGDPLERPVASYEVGALVRVAVAVSRTINAGLGLDKPFAEGEEPPENRVQEGLLQLRRKRWRVDLRPLADMRNLFWFPVAWYLCVGALRLAGMIIRGLAAAGGQQ